MAAEGTEFSNILIDRLKGKSQAQVAAKAGVDPSTLSLLAKGSTRIGKPSNSIRIQLAAALAESVEEAEGLAIKFVDANPKAAGEKVNIRDEVARVWIQRLQTKMKGLRLGCPFFFDDSPLVLAHEKQLFQQCGFRYSDLTYISWKSILPSYLHTEAQNSDAVKLSVHTLDLAHDHLGETDSQSSDFVFCFPLAIYMPSAFAIQFKKDRLDIPAQYEKGKKIPIEERLERFAEATNGSPLIYCGGDDMERNTRKALEFRKNGPTIKPRILGRDQYDALESFLQLDGGGHAFASGVPQRLRGEDQGLSILITGDEVDSIKPQFNGLVCRGFSPDDRTKKAVVIQALCAWYLSLKFISSDLGTAGTMIAELISERVPPEYRPHIEGDFKECWKPDNPYYRIPRTPTAMLKEIQSQPYPFEEFDYTRLLLKDVLALEPILERLEPW